MKRLFIASVALLVGGGCCWSANAAELYGEPLRPQFHFTPERNWMNDPNGMVYFDGEYHLFYQYNPFGNKWGHMSWGHAVSPDLVRWKHLPLALAEEDGVMIFSGSAVVDWKNTSGFGKDGKPPMVAIYTGHYTGKPLQNQQIAYSNDRGRTWTKYEENPVLDIGEKDFRDPKVFWHEETGRWIMVVSWPVKRQVRFYSSPNLKKWTHLSDFGPAGSTSGIWECPDLFPLPVEGTAGEKWALIVNVGSGAPAGGSGCQYFVGEFDGDRFTLDPSFPKPISEFVPEGRVLADFEAGDYGKWKVEGNAFGSAPALGALPGQQTVDGFRGRGLVNSFNDHDAGQGSLTSPEFTIDEPYLSFLMGGGDHAGKTCMNLKVKGETVRTATGQNSERLAWRSWDVRDLQGKNAVLEIVDRHTGGWGHINVDHIILADRPARPPGEAALWADFGPDFYAAVSWSDVPDSDGRRLWIGWMSNWQYANDVPTSPWRSAMSLPRSLSLRKGTKGYRLIQHPVRELERLRGERHRLGKSTVVEATRWLAGLGKTGGIELDVEFEVAGSAAFGLNLFKGGNETLVVRCDPAGGILTVDRSRSVKGRFHDKFSRKYEAPLRVREGRVQLRMFLDASSVDLFANGGETVLTVLALPDSKSRGVELWAEGNGRINRLQVWELKSAWK